MGGSAAQAVAVATQVGLAIIAPLAFTATSRLSYIVRSTMDVPSATVVDEAGVQGLLDAVADKHGLRCRVCEPIGEGRVYAGGGFGGASSLVVNLDGENRELFFATSGYARDGRRGVLALSADISAAAAERFPGIMATTFEEGHERHAWEQATTFEVTLSSDGGLSVESAESAKRTLSSIVEDIVRTHGLRTDATSLVYYAGRRVGVSAFERDFVLVPAYTDNATLQVEATSSRPRFDELQRAVADDLTQRLRAAFGPSISRYDRLREAPPQ